MYRFLLCGNPNVGKSTLFNSLTKSNEHTGNFHGVTVEEKSKTVKFNNQEFQFVDLPGIYSLNCYSFEEEVSKQKLLTKQGVILLVDANSLRRNLYLSLQLQELNIPHHILINNYDYFKNKHNKLNLELLKNLLNKNVDIINAKKIKLKEFLKIVENDNKNGLNYYQLNNIEKNNSKNLQNNSVLNENLNSNLPYLKDFLKIIKNKFDLDDFTIISAINGDFSKINNNLKEVSEFIKNLLPKIVEARYKFIDEVLDKCLSFQTNFVYGNSKLDKFFLKPILMTLSFVILFLLSIYIIFFNLGVVLSDLLISCFDFLLINPIMNFLYSTMDNVWVLQFFEGGVFSSITTVFSFIPQVCLLYVFLSVLEDSGIIARLAYVLDDFLSKFGLNGKAIYIMLLGFGCNTVSCMASRNMDNKNLKTKSAILNPYMSCMARLPIFVLIASTFFSKYAYFVVAGLYLLGVIVALILAFILNKTILPNTQNSMLMEFPPIRGISFVRLINVAFVNAKDMIKRIFSVVLSAGIIVWILTHTKFNLQFTENITESILFFLSDKISFVFAPIGLNSAGIVCALIVGVLAKELIVSTFAICNNSVTNKALISSLTLATSVINFNVASAVSFLIFSLLYSPCISNIAVLKKEVGGYFTTFAILSQFTIAYMLSFIVYQSMRLGFWFALICVVIITLIMFSVTFAIKKIKKGKCVACTGCNNS